VSKASGITWRIRNREKEAERSRIWRLEHPGATTEQARAWRAANPEMARAAELRNQHRRLMKRLQYGPMPKRRARSDIGHPRGKDMPVVQRWLTQKEWT
jgi:hypothetical protein